MTVRIPAGSRSDGDFWLDEFGGSQLATTRQLEQLRQLVDDVLQPIRDRWGPVIPTSWTVWSDGTPRTGAHASGGAADIVVPGQDHAQVHRWAAGALRGRYGELGLEDDHIHVTIPPIGGTGDVWIERGPGQYERPPWIYEIEGLEITVGRDPAWMRYVWWILATLAALELAAPRRKKS